MSTTHASALPRAAAAVAAPDWAEADVEGAPTDAAAAGVTGATAADAIVRLTVMCFVPTAAPLGIPTCRSRDLHMTWDS